MGRCITIITLTGATSLGLLTGSLAYQSLKAIPELIRQLNNQASLKTAGAEPVLAAIKTNLTVSNVANIVLGTLSTWLFSTAYRCSPAVGKHPYLVYSALGAPLALAALYYQTGALACVLTGPFGTGDRLEQVVRTKLAQIKQKCCENKQRKQKDQKKEITEATEAKTSASPADDSLDSSYIHISEESSGVSSPETPVEATESVSSSIEDEVEDALAKKERVKDLETVGAAYNVASVIAGVGFAICSVGVIGDRYFL